VHNSNYLDSRDSATGIFIVGTVHFYRSDVHNRDQKAFVNNFSGVLTHKSSPEPHAYLKVCEIFQKNIVTYDRNFICLLTDLSRISVKCYVFFTYKTRPTSRSPHCCVPWERHAPTHWSHNSTYYIFLRSIFLIVFIFLIVLLQVDQYNIY